MFEEINQVTLDFPVGFTIKTTKFSTGVEHNHNNNKEMFLETLDDTLNKVTRFYDSSNVNYHLMSHMWHTDLWCLYTRVLNMQNETIPSVLANGHLLLYKEESSIRVKLLSVPSRLLINAFVALGLWEKVDQKLKKLLYDAYLALLHEEREFQFLYYLKQRRKVVVFDAHDVFPAEAQAYGETVFLFADKHHQMLTEYKEFVYENSVGVFTCFSSKNEEPAYLSIEFGDAHKAWLRDVWKLLLCVHHRARTQKRPHRVLDQSRTHTSCRKRQKKDNGRKQQCNLLDFMKPPLFDKQLLKVIMSYVTFDV